MDRNNKAQIVVSSKRAANRYSILHWLCFVIFFAIAIRLVQVQVVKADYYEQLAQSEHTRSWELKAERGTIFMRDGDSGVVPVAINSTAYNLSASPVDINVSTSGLSFLDIAAKITQITGGDKREMAGRLEGSRKKSYLALSKRLTSDQAREINKLKIYGLFLDPVPQRQYPEGNLAAHVLGFVNVDGKGQYGVEQFYNKELAGTNGSLKALSTASGDPLILPGDSGTVEVPPEQGKGIVLSLDRGLQNRLEDLADESKERFNADSVSVLIMKADTGKILGMAGSPSFNPAEYYKTDDISVFTNKSITDSQELGSIVKVLTMASGINEGVVDQNSTYNNTGSIEVDDRTIHNAVPGKYLGTNTMTDVLKYSLNTGVDHVLIKMGGSNSINRSSRDLLYKYFYNDFNLGQDTGVDLAGESSGKIFSPEHEQGNAVRYSNMAFGQGLTVSPIQAAAALGSIVNDGTYMQPSVVESIGDEVQQPKVIREGVVSADTSEQIRNIMSQAGGVPKIDGYRIGLKTGTAQLLESNGTYSKDKTRGTTFGFVQTGEGSYIIMVKVEYPKLSGFAGSESARPIFQDTAHWLVDYYQPKKLPN